MQWYNTSMKKPESLQARFICSAERSEQLPAAQGDEFCVMGRSNVGKSSFINHVFADRGLARVSKRPGKTTLANFYRINDGTTWVDLPGYGFAFAPKGEKVRWDRLIEDYCGTRKSLKGCIWLLDIRHAGLPADAMACRWFQARRMRVFPVLTKSDKLSKQEIALQSGAFMDAFGLAEEPVIYSIMLSECRADFIRRFQQWQNALT
jgi:GTP-binding protein